MFVHGRHGEGFWAYDVAAGILLKFLIDAAQDYAEREHANWLGKCISSWRQSAVLLANAGLYFDINWSVEELSVIRQLIEDACDSSKKKGSISAREMQAWEITVFARGHDPFPAGPIAELGQAILDLLSGNLPKPPEQTWWFYGLPTGRATIAQRE
jgi:hypothetical protein